MTWPLVPLREIIKVHYGKALKENDRVQDGEVTVYGSSGPVGKHNKALFLEPTLIIGRKGSVGEITYAHSGSWTIDTAFFVEILNQSRTDLRYLYYALHQAKLVKHTITTSIPGINRDDIYGTNIPFPSFSEQRRIAAILDKADAIRRKRQRAIERMEDFLRSVFLDMFGDPVTNPKGWKICKLHELCEEVVDCPHSTPHYTATETSYFCIRSSDIQNSYLDWSTTKCVDASEYSKRVLRTVPQEEDVIYCREGARFGNAARIIDHQRICLGQRMMLFRAKRDIATSEFIWAFLIQESTYQQAIRISGGSASPHVNVQGIKRFSTIIPPKQIQERFSSPNLS